MIVRFFKHPLLYVAIVLIAAFVSVGWLRPVGTLQQQSASRAQEVQARGEGETVADVDQKKRVKDDPAVVPKKIEKNGARSTPKPPVLIRRRTMKA